MSSAPQPNPAMPIQGGPQTAIPQTDIPHMGTSQANVPNPNIEPQAQAPAQAPVQTPPQAPAQNTGQPTQPAAQSVPLPPGITQDAINAAIAHVQETGNTDGISPEVLGAACAQIEAQAAAQGIDLNQAAPPPQGPTSHVEAAVVDKQGTMDAFSEQRDSLKDAVANQREAMQQPYKDALSKVGVGNPSQMSPETMAELTSAIKDLDPTTVALINAMGALNSNPSIINNVIWIEVIRTVRSWIASETKKQVQSIMNPPPV